MSRSDTALRYFKENQTFMDTLVAANIERYRKGDCILTLTDETGRPMADKTVRVKLTDHAFRFGANLFMLDELETAAKNETYRKEFPRVYNLGTIPFYWSDMEPQEGQIRFPADSVKIYRRPAIDLCLAYCEENGIEPKCHCLNYDNFTPKWVDKANVALHKSLLERRFAQIAAHCAARIPSFEVTNETLDDYLYEKSAFYREDDFVEWSFRTADRYFKNNRLIINQSSEVWEKFRDNRSQYYMQIERLRQNGIVHLDSIGFQFHSFFGREAEERMAALVYNPLHLYRVMDRYAAFGKPLQITEMTIPAYGDSAENEEVQAELIRNLYTVFFSHPAMEAVIYWNMVDGYAAWTTAGDMQNGENKYYGGVLRFDLTEKPAFKELYKLFHETYTTDLTLTTDSNGQISFRGFYGDYALTGEGVNKTFTLTKGTTAITL